MNAASGKYMQSGISAPKAGIVPLIVASSCDAFAAREDMAVVHKRISRDCSDRPSVCENSVVSDTTMSSSEHCSSSDDSSSEEPDDDNGAHVLSDDGERVTDEHTTHQETCKYLDKSRLQVCPVDDLAVEDEKRRRRSRQNLRYKVKGKNAPLHGASRDAESLPSTSSPIRRRTHRSGSNPAVRETRTCSTPAGSLPPPCHAHETRRSSIVLDSRNESSSVAASIPLLRKDSAAIRRQYWSQLGFSLSRNDLEKSTGRKKERQQGLKVRLNDAELEQDHGAKGFLRLITSWYAPVTAVDADEKPLLQDTCRVESARHSRSLTGFATSPRNPNDCKKVLFNEEAELFYIPLHRDYSKRQRECMWPTRAEFIAMVERNLDAVYEEMEREYETQVGNEHLENENMAREEARQRTIETQQRTINETAAAEWRRSLSPPQSRSSSILVPSLTLSQKQVLLSPRARSSHDLRFKYLKHLGIDS
ncbi:hypothetical protein CCR75_004684 [Bremia lactucae]|uniref:Uncharacterized protein n=1 Tax=Bremia lactucae TaxID=4779 RepID=A0A976FFS2_BRELC|nr:hypothetical protein CCR75_004684 [Bremia lactucae]